MPKIEKIVDKRSGISKKTNKPWEILICNLDDGTESVQIFGPGKEGDEVTPPTFNEEYDCTQAKIIRPDKNAEVMDALRKIYAQNEQILKLLDYKPHTKSWDATRDKFADKKNLDDTFGPTGEL